MAKKDKHNLPLPSPPPPPPEIQENISPGTETVPYEVIAASKPFRFLVGPNEKEFMMHADLVARLSKPLATLVNGKMKEAKEGVVEWPEFDEETFVKFCQFAYTGDYVVAAPQCVSTEEPKQEADGRQTPQKEDKGHCLIEPSEPSGQSLAPASFFFNELWSRFTRTTFATPKPYVPSEERPYSAPTDHAEVLLRHAHIYVLADYCDIERLMVLSLEKLHKALVDFDLADHNIDAIVALLDYCFANTVDKSSGKDSLRVLVVRYVASKLSKLWKSDDFQNIMERHPDLSRPVIGEMLKRLMPGV